MTAEHHGHIHLDEADWAASADQTELENELVLGFVTDTMAWIAELRGPDAPPVRRVLDIGSGPGVGTCELARLFPEASVVAVDSSPAMLDRTRRRAVLHGLDGRIDTHLAELPGGLEAVERADVIWASMSLHHVGDEIAALRVLGGRLEPFGLVAIAELAESTRLLPHDVGVGRPGLGDRLDRAGSDWFAAMREGLPGSVPSTELPSMLTAAGLDVLGSRIARERFDPPLDDDARRVALGYLRRARDHFGDRLDTDDLRTIDVLTDPADPLGLLHRDDVFVDSSRQVVIARRS